MELNLTKPIIFLDLETTGVQIATDRIVEISMVRIQPDGQEARITERLNPTIPIPPQSTEIHGITDEDVRDKPTFADRAAEYLKFIGQADLAGYNLIKFDIPLLVEEFLRVNLDLDLSVRRIIDVQNIFHKMEPRTLSAAYRFYCGKELVDAHSAEADTLATYEILKAQLDRYKGVAFTDKNGKESFPVKNDMDMLSAFSYHNKNADLAGHLIYNDKGVEVFNFGKHKGKPVEKVFKEEPQYYDWMMKSQFPRSTKKVITSIYMRAHNNGTITLK
ncbi:MAG: 3'-5' exonuclease [Bacteroidales bacterium]